MDPICQNEEDNSGFQQYVENQFDMLLQDFDKFQKTSLLPHPINPTSGNSGPPQSTTQQHFTTLLQDFEEFENTIFPPNQTGPIYVKNMNNTSATRKFDTEGHHDHSTQNREATTSTNACVDAGGTVVGSFTRYANITTYCGSGNGGSSSGGGTVMSSVLKLANLSTCRIQNRGSVMMGSFLKYGFSVQGTVGAKGKVNAPRRMKRKYRGVYETEAQFILRMERQKIKNRETAARSHENKQAYEAHLLAQVQKLRQRNKFLKKLLAFLQNPRINLPRKPLKRTISGPI